MKFAIPVDDTTSAKITGRRGGKRTAMEAAAREALASGEHAHIVSSAENRCLNGICPPDDTTEGERSMVDAYDD